MGKCHDSLVWWFTYPTPKMLKIKSIGLGIFCRVVQIFIVGYIVGFVILYHRGYQKTSRVQSAITVKVKGSIYTNFSEDEFDPHIENPKIYQRLWDISDIVIPHTQEGSFFVSTNVIIQHNQNRSTCPEDITDSGTGCTPQKNICRKGDQSSNKHGVRTGKCVPARFGKGYACEVHAWCPVLINVTPLKDKTKPLLPETEHFTVFIRNVVSFPAFPGSVRRNIKHLRDGVNRSYLLTCMYDPVHHYGCPRFKLGDIVHGANTNYSDIAVHGGIIIISIEWDCDFDYDVENCFPKYTFFRGDNPINKMFRGWHFRFGMYYDNGRRTSFKLYGIKFILDVHGKGRKFSIKVLLLKLGGGLGLLALQVVICDIFVIYVVKDREFYKSKKYEDVFEPPPDEPLPPIYEDEDLSSSPAVSGSESIEKREDVRMTSAPAVRITSAPAAVESKSLEKQEDVKLSSPLPESEPKPSVTIIKTQTGSPPETVTEADKDKPVKVFETSESVMLSTGENLVALHYTMMFYLSREPVRPPRHLGDNH